MTPENQMAFKFQFNPKLLLKSGWQRLHEIRDAPHAVAGGVAIGVFWGFTPFTGLKTLLSMLTAWLARCSKLSAVIAVSLHDVLVPVWIFILRWEYQIGVWILSNPHHFPPKLRGMGMHHLMTWRTLELLWPTFVGSLCFGLPSALISYWVVESLLERYQRKHHLLLTPPA